MLEITQLTHSWKAWLSWSMARTLRLAEGHVHGWTCTCPLKLQLQSETCGLHGQRSVLQGKLPSWTIKAASPLPGRGWVEVGGKRMTGT